MGDMGSAFREGSVDADGFRIRYQESGEGPPLVHLHGADRAKNRDRQYDVCLQSPFGTTSHDHSSPNVLCPRISSPQVTTTEQ